MIDEQERTPPPVQLTSKAIEQVKVAIKREHASKESGLRILLVNGGGGYRYDLQFETDAQNGDHVSLQGGLKIYVDAISQRYIQGTELDFLETPQGSGFLFRKPEG